MISIDVLPIAMGLHPKYVMAELLGKKTGSSNGKGGSMHMFSKEHNCFGGHGIVGGQIPLGAGIAFADKYNDSDAVTICFMGDGAVRQGVLHETFNMAMNWDLPVVFVCENICLVVFHFFLTTVRNIKTRINHALKTHNHT